MAMTAQQMGRKGGKARAKKLSARRRKEIARKAGIAGNKKRWGKKKSLDAKRRRVDTASRSPE